MKLVDVSLQTREKEASKKGFNKNTWCITDLFLKCLEPFDSTPIKKCIIEVHSSAVFDGNIEDLLDVIIVYIRFDFTEYFRSDNYNKKLILLNLILKGMQSIGKIQGWPISNIEKSFNCCFQKELKNIWLHKNKYILSPAKNYYGGVICEWEIDKFEVFGVILNRQREQIFKEKLFEREPWDIEALGKMVWGKNERDFFLFSKNNIKKWNLQIPASF